MAYGRKPTFKRTGTNKRSTAIRAVQKQARFNKVQANRKKTAGKARRTNTRGILANARAISRLTKKMWGPVQVQRSYTDIGNKITANSPWCFHVTSPGSDYSAPYIYHRNPLGIASPIGQFKKFTGHQASEDAENIPNHPCFLKSVLLEFEFAGFVDDTHITVHLVQSKGIAKPDYYFEANTTANNLLPKSLMQFTNLAGFTQERIDRKAFKVLASRRLYMNSRPMNPTAADVTSTILGAIVNDNYPTVPATTRAVKRCRIYLPVNRELKVLDNGTPFQEPDGGTDHHRTFTGVDDKGIFSYANMDPKSQVWCIISTSDQTALDAAFTGDAVQCTIHRTCTWRDPHD